MKWLHLGVQISQSNPIAKQELLKAYPYWRLLGRVYENSLDSSPRTQECVFPISQFSMISSVASCFQNQSKMVYKEATAMNNLMD